MKQKSPDRRMNKVRGKLFIKIQIKLKQAKITVKRYSSKIVPKLPMNNTNNLTIQVLKK